MDTRCHVWLFFFYSGRKSFRFVHIRFFFLLVFMLFFFSFKGNAVMKRLCVWKWYGVNNKTNGDTLGYRLWDLGGKGISEKRKKLEMGTDGRT